MTRRLPRPPLGFKILQSENHAVNSRHQVNFWPLPREHIQHTSSVLVSKAGPSLFVIGRTDMGMPAGSLVPFFFFLLLRGFFFACVGAGF